MDRIIGYIRSRYPELRCIIKRGGDENRYVQIGKWRNRFLMLSRAREILTGKVLRRHIGIDWNKHAIYKPTFSPRVNVIHTFNTVCDTIVPWVTSFETAVPRTKQTCSRDWQNGKVAPDSITQYGFELLARDSCGALIAISEANKNIQLSMMEAMDIPNREVIANKIVVLPPPQPVLITPEELNAKFDAAADRLEFIFVGGLFFRKSGAQMLEAFKSLRNQYQNFHLTVISSLSYGDSVSQTTAEDQAHWRAFLESTDWITFYEKLPNPQVLELCKKAHVGLLPTMADTYGYSVIEMQSCGCAVITTDSRALSEMNNEECGYLIHVPKHSSSEAKYDTPEDLETLKSTIYDGLYHIISGILAEPEKVKAKAQAAVAKISRDHSPEKYAEKLSELYSKACTK